MGKEKTILIVEDNENNFLLLKIQILSINSNIKVLRAANGKISVEMCKENSEIDLIFMDIRMPIMDGHEATEIISEILPEVPIIYQTAYDFKDNFVEAGKSGGSNYITKPIDLETVNLVLDRYLN